MRISDKPIYSDLIAKGTADVILSVEPTPVPDTHATIQLCGKPTGICRNDTSAPPQRGR